MAGKSKKIDTLRKLPTDLLDSMDQVLYHYTAAPYSIITLPYRALSLHCRTALYHYTALSYSIITLLYRTLSLHCCTVLYHYTAVLYSIITLTYCTLSLHSPYSNNTLPYRTVPYFTPLCSTVNFHTMILCTMLYRTILHFNITCCILVYFVMQYHRTINHDKTNSTMRFVYKTILALMYVYIIPSSTNLIFILSISFIPSSHNLIYSNPT